MYNFVYHNRKCVYIPCNSPDGDNQIRCEDNQNQRLDPLETESVAEFVAQPHHTSVLAIVLQQQKKLGYSPFRDNAS